VAGFADVLYIPWVTPFHAVAMSQLLSEAGVPAVFLVHNAAPHEWFPATTLLTRRVLNRADHLVAHSSKVVEDLRRFGVTVPASVVPHPANLDLTPVPAPPDPPRRLLFLGFVRPYKGLELLISALALLPAEFRLTVAGEFWIDRGETDRLIDRLGVTDRVEVIDRYIPDDEVADLLARHHLVVAPYRSATQSGIVPLAFAAGRPVVATAVGGLAEAVDDGSNGVLCLPTAESISEGIRGAADRYDQLLAGAQSTKWSWSEVVDAIVRAVMGR
jgi:glycosyltransferase involved in cell wall biosynthesis